jgi:hypothetical protein
MGATFYTEPVLTFDLDVFVLISASTGKLVSLTPIYEALRQATRWRALRAGHPGSPEVKSASDYCTNY